MRDVQSRHRESILDCDILIVGGSAGGVAAALGAAESGATVCLLEETDWLGGQLTSQGVCTPDEQKHIETFGGTRRYVAFRDAVRGYYRTEYRLSEQEILAQSRRDAENTPISFNPGSCWVSRISFEPKVGAMLLREMTRPYEESGRLQVYFGARAAACVMDSCEPGRIEQVVATLRDGSELRFFPRFVLDATDLGELLPMCGEQGVDWIVGAESAAETGEPDAPNEAKPHWVQPFTFPFALDWSPETADTNVINPPDDYEELKASQKYHVKQGAITGLFSGAMPWWTYRRVLAAANFNDPRITSDLVMINTAGNDYYGGSVLGEGEKLEGESGSVGEGETSVAETLARARRASLGFLYWLQTECPRERADLDSAPGTQLHYMSDTPSPNLSHLPVLDPRLSLGARENTGRGTDPPQRRTPNTKHLMSDTRHPTRGYPEFRLRKDVFDTEDGCSIRPYIRESRRIRSMRPVLEQEIVVKDFHGNVCRGDSARAALMPDTVGSGHYALDIHPNGHGEPNHYVATRPFQIPLGALIPVRLTNLLPACKNLGVTHLTNGAYRLHPIEWNIGESSGALAAWCLARSCTPREVYENKNLLSAFQEHLTAGGIALHWYIDVPLDHAAFRAVQWLVGTGARLGSDTDLLFRPDQLIYEQEWLDWQRSCGLGSAQYSASTRAEAAIALWENRAQSKA